MKCIRAHGLAVWYREGTPDEEVLEQSFDKDIFYPVIRDYRPGPRDTVIDVGAHIGAFSLLAASRSPQGKILAIEPCAETWELLAKNVAVNELRTIVPLRMALAGRKGTATLYHNLHDGNWGHSITKDTPTGGEQVQTETLAGLMDAYDLATVDLIKLNCEGAEFDVLLNTDEVHLKRIGLMIVLYHMDMVKEPGLDDQALLRKLCRCGFFCRVLYKTPSRGWIVARNKQRYSWLADLARRVARRALRSLARA